MRSSASSAICRLAPDTKARNSAAPSKAELEALLERHDWVVAQAAREIDRDHAVVWRWIKRYGLDVGRVRPEPTEFITVVAGDQTMVISGRLGIGMATSTWSRKDLSTGSFATLASA